MLYRLFPALALVSGIASAELTIEPYNFEARGQEPVAAELGRFNVPAHHEDANRGSLDLGFVRFPSTNPNPGHPIVYLAGGPGGSGTGTAKGARFSLFMALREVADVIAFDQRGTGLSNPPMGCRAAQPFPAGLAINRENWLNYASESAKYCHNKWQAEGVDLSAYTTWQSARDLEILRKELGAEKLNLWGISYGTHLALAALKAMPDRIERVVLASAEGLDQTVKLPAHADQFFARVEQAVVAAGAVDRYPDLVNTMRRVLTKLDQQPVTVSIIPQGHSEPVDISFDSTVIRFYTAFFLTKNPSNIANLPATYAALDAGHFDPVAMGVYQLVYASPTGFGAMSTAMDVASGISSQRLALVNEQAKTAIMGDFMNYPMPHLIEQFPSVPDLGESFRAPFKTEVPALFLTGTLDGRTFPEAHAEVMAQFANAQQLVIENAGHDLFMVAPEVTTAIKGFLANGKAGISRLQLPPPQFN
ncbi:MAG: alpha/beta hydrolase [Lysobacteraceae bacterium]|nr:MAG: alpha/beta hydrolase [Xanthomonadaceae bacterium]